MSGSGVITQTPTAPAAGPAVRAAHDGTVVATTVLGAVPVRFGEAPAAFSDADPDSEPAAGLPSGSALLRTGLPVRLAGAFPMTAWVPRRAAVQPLRADLTLSATESQPVTRSALFTRSVSATQPLPATRSVPAVQSLSAAQLPKPAPTPPTPPAAR